MRPRLNLWLLAAHKPFWRISFLVSAAAVLTLSLMPARIHAGLDWDKANHFASFAWLMLLACSGWRTRRLKLALLLVGFGVAIEVLQGFTPDRSPEVLDVLADSVGIAGGILLWASLRRAWRRWQLMRA